MEFSNNFFPELFSDQLINEPNLAHLITPSNLILDPDYYKPQIIDHHTPQGLKKLQELSSLHYHNPVQDISTKPFTTGATELLELTGFFNQIFNSINFDGSSPEESVEKIVLEKIQSIDPNIPKTDISNLLRSNSLIVDLTDLIQMGRQVSQSDVIEKQSKWVWSEADNKLTKYIGPEARRVLSMSRMLGLIPFNEIRKLRSTRFRILGASVASSTIDLLTSLGAEDILFVDGGILTPSNEGRMTGDLADFKNIGQVKSLMLMKLLYKRNPYGNFLGLPGKVVLSSNDKGLYDITLEELTADADQLIEVVDDPVIKVAARIFGTDKHSSTPIGFIADLGNIPFAGIEDPESGDYFNQQLPDEEKERLKSILTITEKEHLFSAGLRAIYKMVENNFPPDHQYQFLLSSLGLIPYWSQTPIASRLSASTYVSIFLKGIKGENIPSNQIPTSLNPVPKKNAIFLNKILDKLLK